MAKTRNKRANRSSTDGATRSATDWRRIAWIAAGVIGTAAVVGAVARHRTARRVGLLGLAHLAERNAARLADATQSFAQRWWPRVSDTVVGAVQKPVAMITRH